MRRKAVVLFFMLLLSFDASDRLKAQDSTLLPVLPELTVITPEMPTSLSRSPCWAAVRCVISNGRRAAA